jgi:hypothetical protein
MVAKIDAKMNTTLEEMNASQNETLARMERMMNTDQTDVTLKELAETIEKKNTSEM